jgi:CheY-like chemotaxis protein
MTSDRESVIVLADDDLLFSSRISDTLSRLGYRAVAARTAAAVDAAVRDAALRGARCLVIMNLAARGFDAQDAIRRIKQDVATRDTPVLGFCGHRDVARAEAARAAGCDAVTTNGAVSLDLLRVLKPLMERISPPAGAT